MTAFKRFEDIEVWQKARDLSMKIYPITQVDECSKDFGFINQIKNSSGSIMDNIAEGFERGGNKEFILFLSYAKGSAGEVKSQLYRALDQGYINKEHFKELYQLSDEICKMISGLMSYLSKSTYKGPKYKHVKITK